MSAGEDIHLLTLPPRLDFAEAPALLASLRKLGDEGSAARIDASSVEAVALPCLQILLSAAKTCPGLIVENPAPALLTAFHDLRLEWPFTAAMKADDAEESVSTAVPIDVDSLPQMGAGSVAPETPSAANEIDEEPMLGPTPGKMILTIDDSRTIRDLLMLTLTEAGYDVLQGVDGQDGLDVLGDRHVDLIITDINMPKMDGYEVIRRVRAKSSYSSTPILVLTTESDKEKRTIAREAGATGWLVKPFDPDRLIETVRKVVP